MCETLLTKVKNTYKCLAHTHAPKFKLTADASPAPTVPADSDQANVKGRPTPPTWLFLVSPLPALISRGGPRSTWTDCLKGPSSSPFPQDHDPAEAPGTRLCCPQMGPSASKSWSRDRVPGDPASGCRGCRPDSTTPQLRAFGQIT